MPARLIPLLPLLLVVWIPRGVLADVVRFDISGVRPGPVKVEQTVESAIVQWPDEPSRQWKAEFSLDPEKPLLTAISVDGRRVVEQAEPLYWCETGKRRGGWDEFFDRPFTHPEGTRRFTGVF